MKLLSMMITFLFILICQEVHAQKENNSQDSVLSFQKSMQRKIVYNLSIDSKDIPKIDPFCAKTLASDNFYNILYSVVDSLYPLNKRYTDQHGNNLNGSFFSLVDNRLDEIGIYKSHGISFLSLETKLSGCFKNGIPCCTWKYYIYDRYSSGATTVIANFENGVFQGKYKIQTSTGFIYETIFDQGSGYYLDAYSDGVIRIKGMLKEGKMEGMWIFNIQKKGKQKPKYKKITRIYKDGILVK